MSAIPEDIMETAQKVWREADGKILKTDAYVVIALAILAERERSHTLLSEAEQREKDARRVALGDAAEAIFVMGAWHPNYEKITANTFDEGTSAAYEIIRELQGKAESALQSEDR